MKSVIPDLGRQKAQPVADRSVSHCCFASILLVPNAVGGSSGLVVRPEVYKEYVAPMAYMEVIPRLRFFVGGTTYQVKITSSAKSE